MEYETKKSTISTVAKPSGPLLEAADIWYDGSAYQGAFVIENTWDHCKNSEVFSVLHCILACSSRYLKIAFSKF